MTLSWKLTPTFLNEASIFLKILQVYDSECLCYMSQVKRRWNPFDMSIPWYLARMELCLRLACNELDFILTRRTWGESLDWKWVSRYQSKNWVPVKILASTFETILLQSIAYMYYRWRLLFGPEVFCDNTYSVKTHAKSYSQDGTGNSRVGCTYKISKTIHVVIKILKNDCNARDWVSRPWSQGFLLDLKGGIVHNLISIERIS